jgi:hypothetical protein
LEVEEKRKEQAKAEDEPDELSLVEEEGDLADVSGLISRDESEG